MPRYTTTLFDVAVSNYIPSETTIRSIMAQSLAALVDMHSRGYAHRDFSGANILLNFDEDGTPRVFVSDFGFAAHFPSKNGVGVPADLTVGTLPYHSPESLLCCPNCDPFKNDIWALGITLHHLMTKKLDWLKDVSATDEERHYYQLKYTFRSLAFFFSPIWDEIADPKTFTIASEVVFAANPIYVQDFSAAAINFISLLLQPNPLFRPTALEALQDPWFDPIDSLLKTISKQKALEDTAQHEE